MRKRTLFVVLAAALTASVGAPLAWAKKTKWHISFQVSDDPRAGFVRQATDLSMIRGKVDGSPVYFVTFYNPFEAGDPGRPRLHFAIPDIDYAKQEYPLDVVPARLGWMHYPQSGQSPRRWAAGAGSTVKVTLTKYDRKRRTLSGEFSFLALEDADPTNTLLPVDVTGTFSESLPAPLDRKPNITFTMSQAPGLEFQKAQSTYESNGSFLFIDVQPAMQPISPDVGPVHLHFTIPQVDFASQTFPLPLTASQGGLELDGLAQTPDGPFGNWTIDGTSTAGIVITGFDRKKKLLSGTYSFTHLTAGQVAHSVATADVSGSFVFKVKLNKP